MLSQTFAGILLIFGIEWGGSLQAYDAIPFPKISVGEAKHVTFCVEYSSRGLAIVTTDTARADTATESLKQGDPIGAFYVTKVAGADDDGVEAGQELCYRCRYGSRPMVMVFTRETGGKVTELVKELDSAVGANEEAQLKGLITLMGEDASALKDDATKIAKKSGAKHIPLAVAKDTETGPENYKLSSDAAVTIVVANDSQVVATHTFAADKIDIAAVMTQVKQMLN